MLSMTKIAENSFEQFVYVHAVLFRMHEKHRAAEQC